MLLKAMELCGSQCGQENEAVQDQVLRCSSTHWGKEQGEDPPWALRRSDQWGETKTRGLWGPRSQGKHLEQCLVHSKCYIKLAAVVNSV